MFEKVIIKYNGRSHEWPVAELDLPSEQITDSHVLAAVTQRLDSEGVAVHSLTGYSVDPPESERLSGQHEGKTVLNVRPTATFG